MPLRPTPGHVGAGNLNAHQTAARPLTEKQFQKQVEELLRLRGWRFYHTWKSFNSARGFPDIFAVRPPRAVALELKTSRGKVTPEQEAWVAAMAECGIEAGIWRPDEWDELVELLR
jgi:VRR-NUC domain